MNGLSLRIKWGNQRLHSALLRANGSGFCVGTAAGVDFPTGDVSGAARFTLVPARDARTVRFARGMSGALWRGEQQLTLQEAVDRGEAVPDEGAYAVTLADRDAVLLEVSGLEVEALPVKVPRAVKADPLGALDLRLLNVLAAVFALAFVGVLSAESAHAEAYSDDDSVSATRSLAKFVMPPPAPPKPKARAAATKEPAAPGKASAAPPKPRPDDAPVSHGRDPKQVAQQLGRFMNQLLAGHERSSDPLGQAIGAIRATGFASTGVNGIGLKGNDGPGAGGQLIGLGGIDRPGRGRGTGGHCDGICLGKLGGSGKVDIFPAIDGTSEVEVRGMDKELIRQVIHSHRDQVRYCYELGLTRNPSLAGKTAVRFFIGGGGDVTTAKVVESSVSSHELETCIAGRVGTWKFPKPPGGGTVMVTYPFVFQRAGR